ncbi:GMC family oxidoreductase N-terminal domain-containing protein [Mycobacterium sp. CVI_P3]|uniref:GMC family oxidoreductase N-terminal domain-containing protein n=1 Tax=Mycobacterium pinniadriaticum TaxID=2994102 RepID=A0ABT3SMX3_9MYCO|nr:GMC family oxidoreductase N-terminal domain-containing protein [Mycobacterium pinniadriaticum]MCX2934454.1 GMC family oxidoreductase N-terminal domain-containing protein [Mycobacterium pinniadriaticum]MCX2940877.1 GMC family oxidoreductase N-terminal domain-containing protein [Mycobacterium pinniadriaticum]
MTTSGDNFDYVVVGGGSSGSVVAARLARAGADVLLLEAGGSDRRIDVRIPAAVAIAYQKVNWKYPAEPDPTRTGNPEAWMAGKVMGGGGSINSCVFVRGNRADYDGWAKNGCTGWDYDSVLPAFKRMETWEGGPSELRGGSGPISVNVQTNRGQANMAYMKACLQAGYPSNPDYNGAYQDGVGLAQVNHRRGTRSQASREYLRSVAPKGKLTVRTHSYVYRIVLEGNRAVGVQYRHQGTVTQARAREEVVISAGSIGSPRLLQLSGIGPHSALSDAAVETVVHLPGVGQNLHEHPYLMQRWRSKIPTINKMRIGTAVEGLMDYVRNGSGLLAMTMVQVQCMARTDPGLEAPDLQLQFVPFAITRAVDENGMFNVQPAKEEGFLAASTFLRPRARGSITLRGSAADAMPRISYQFLADLDDLRDCVRGLREVQRVMAQPAMAAITDGQLEPEALCSTDADWEQYVRRTVTPSYHPVGTCKMGIDDLAVVDPELSVHGIANLRVADASIMPTITTGNTNAPSMMIGERAAELILGARPNPNGVTNGSR